MKTKSSVFLAVTMLVAFSIHSFGDLAPRYEMHEWGTFTSVFGSDGTLLTGLDAEEESLPFFVHAHAGMEGLIQPRMALLTKGFRRPLHHVSVKMETPVIYFYSDEPFRAHVEVGFKGGSISQWFPQRSGGEIPPAIERSESGQLISGPIDFAKPYDGSIAWDVDVLEKSAENDSKVFQGGETLAWTHPRMTDANVVRSAEGEHEKYLFYRGVGNFTSSLQPRFSSDDRLRLINAGEETIASLLIFEHRPDGSVRFSFRENLGAGEEESYRIGEEAENSGPWQRPVYEQFVKSLVSAGLFQREADAMARTWWNSYFLRPGLRVFWLMPEKQVEERLPLSVSPSPQTTVRVMVGRAEILTPAFETELLQAHAEDQMDRYRNHFYKAYCERLEQLLPKGGEPKLSANPTIANGGTDL